MRRRYNIFLSLFELLLLLAGLGVIPVRSIDYPVHNLDTGLSYSAIQEAIDALETLDGHTILVNEGIYYESIELNKSNLTLMGKNRSTTVIDGNGTNIVVSLKANSTKITGFTVKNGLSFGILMNPWTVGHVIYNNIIINNHYGLSGHYDCANISILNNVIAFNNVTGLLMDFSFSIVRGNLIFSNGKNEFEDYGSGVQVAVGYLPNNGEYSYCVSNTILGNTIENHKVGIWMTDYSERNLFIHNNFLFNENQFLPSATPWNNTLIENYWDNYNGSDSNNDGVGETSYKISDVVHDESPLMGAFISFNTSIGLSVDIVSNSTVENFQYFESDNMIKIEVSNSSISQTYGFCRVAIPHALVSEPYNVIIDDSNPVYWNYDLRDNGSHRWIYFEYRHSTLEILIVPEFLSCSILILIMMVTLTLRKVSVVKSTKGNYI